MTYCPDPRSLAPPDDPLPPEPEPVWHFLSDDWEHEHWVTDPAAVNDHLRAYAERGTPFTLRQVLDT